VGKVQQPVDAGPAGLQDGYVRTLEDDLSGDLGVVDPQLLADPAGAHAQSALEPDVLHEQQALGDGQVVGRDRPPVVGGCDARSVVDRHRPTERGTVETQPSGESRALPRDEQVAGDGQRVGVECPTRARVGGDVRPVTDQQMRTDLGAGQAHPAPEPGARTVHGHALGDHRVPGIDCSPSWSAATCAPPPIVRWPVTVLPARNSPPSQRVPIPSPPRDRRRRHATARMLNPSTVPSRVPSMFHRPPATVAPSSRTPLRSSHPSNCRRSTSAWSWSTRHSTGSHATPAQPSAADRPSRATWDPAPVRRRPRSARRSRAGAASDAARRPRPRARTTPRHADRPDPGRLPRRQRRRRRRTPHAPATSRHQARLGAPYAAAVAGGPTIVRSRWWLHGDDCLDVDGRAPSSNPRSMPLPSWSGTS
jgi:hypothetical protein